MAAKENIRPGGRSARVQAAIHGAVKQLLLEAGRGALTIPAVAERAGVTPSTIYRRWGDLPNLLADVAVERLRPETDPSDTGSLRSDLEGWLEQYVDEMSSGPGRGMTRDVLACRDGASAGGRCDAFTRSQLALICDRARERGEAAPKVDALMDRVIAPIMYRILFDAAPLDVGTWRAWLDGVLDELRNSP